MAPASPLVAASLTFLGMAATMLGTSLPLIEKGIYRLMGRNPTTSFVRSKTFMAISLGFASGALLYSALFTIMPEAQTSFKRVPSIGSTNRAIVTVAVFALGLVLFHFLGMFVYQLQPDLNCPCHGGTGVCGPQDDVESGSDSETEKVSPVTKAQMTRTAIMTFIAITVHHIPEGMSTYLGAVSNLQFGVSIAFAMVMHNFPEGLSIGMPSYYADGNPWRALLLGALAGVAEPLGALIAWGLSSGLQQVPTDGLGDLGSGFVYGLTAGMMTYTAIKGLLPAARASDPRDRVTTISIMVGMIFFGIAIAAFSYV